jgi:hypothetical protein
MMRAFLRGFWLATWTLLVVGALALLLGIATAYGPAAWQDSKPLDYAILAFNLLLYVLLIYRGAARSGVTEPRPYMAFAAGVLVFNLLLEALFAWDPFGWTAGDPEDRLERLIELATYPGLFVALYQGFKRE